MEAKDISNLIRFNLIVFLFFFVGAVPILASAISSVIFPTPTEPLVSFAIYLLQPLHPMYHMIPVLALTSPPIVLFLLYTWCTPCRITNPFLCILIFLLLLYPLYSPSELEDKVSRQRHLLPTNPTPITSKMLRNKIGKPAHLTIS